MNLRPLFFSVLWTYGPQTFILSKSILFMVDVGIDLVGGYRQRRANSHLFSNVLKHPIVPRQTGAAVGPSRGQVVPVDSRVFANCIHDLSGVSPEFPGYEVKLVGERNLHGQCAVERDLGKFGFEKRHSLYRRIRNASVDRFGPVSRLFAVLPNQDKRRRSKVRVHKLQANKLRLVHDVIADNRPKPVTTSRGRRTRDDVQVVGGGYVVEMVESRDEVII